MCWQIVADAIDATDRLWLVVEHLSTARLEAGLTHIRRAPADDGRVELIVRRPDIGMREELADGTLDPAVGLVGDTWSVRGSRRTADGSAHPDAQLTLMNVRAVALIAGEPDRWSLAGDQLYVDFDIGLANAPAGTRLVIGSTVVELTPEPHTGCAKFSARFGVDALRFVNSPVGKALRLRGANARVIVGGAVRIGDPVRKDTTGPASDRGSVAGERIRQ